MFVQMACGIGIADAPQMIVLAAEMFCGMRPQPPERCDRFAMRSLQQGLDQC